MRGFVIDGYVARKRPAYTFTATRETGTWEAKIEVCEAIDDRSGVIVCEAIANRTNGEKVYGLTDANWPPLVH